MSPHLPTPSIDILLLMGPPLWALSILYGNKSGFLCYYYWQLLSRYVERHSHPLIIFHPWDTFRIFNIHSQDSNFRSIKERSESSSLPSCSTHLKPRINMLAFQTSMSVHTPFLLFDISTIHLPHHGIKTRNHWNEMSVAAKTHWRKRNKGNKK